VVAPRTGSAFWALLLVALFALVGGAFWLHSQLASSHESVSEAWAQVESSYQQRSDLIPVLVETVNRSHRHEEQTLRVRGHGRARVTGIDRAVRVATRAQKHSVAELKVLQGRAPSNEDEIHAIAQTQERVELGLNQLLAVAERYPTLRTADTFLELQEKLEGAETRINVARMQYSETVQGYNATTRKIPHSLIAHLSGFEPKADFNTDEGPDPADPLGLN
jgi:LemA protein